MDTQVRSEMKRSQNQRIIILEPGLKDFSGHYFNLTYVLTKECHQRFIPCVVICNLHAVPEVLEGIPTTTVPFFQFGTYQSTSTDPISAPIENYINVNGTFFTDLPLLTPYLCASDIILVPTASENITAVFVQWIEMIPIGRRPHLVLSYSFNPSGSSDPWAVRKSEMFYRAGFNTVERSRTRPWISLVTNSAIELYREISSTEVHLVPIAQPSRYLVDQYNQTSREAGKIRIVYLGYCIERKGFHLLTSVIRNVLSKCNNVVFSIQIIGLGPNGEPQGKMQEVVDELKSLKNAHPDAIQFLYGTLTHHEYYTALGNADITLAIYSPEYNQISGLLYESIAFEKVIVSRSSSEVQQHGEALGAAMSLFETFDSQSVSNAIVNAAHNFETLSRQAKKAHGLDKFGATEYLKEILSIVEIAQNAYPKNRFDWRTDRLTPYLSLGSQDRVEDLTVGVITKDSNDSFMSNHLFQSDHSFRNGMVFNHVAALERKLNDIYNSTSWRITAPLRWLREWIYRIIKV